MTRCRMIAICAVAAGGLLIAGCGGSTKTSTGTTAPTIVSTTTKPNGIKVLTSAVIAAADADHATSLKALRTDIVPAKPPATAGPALKTLRQSVAGRRARGIRIRMLHERFKVTSVKLDASYATASADVLDVEKVQPVHKNGKAFGQPVTQTERAKLELHRVGGTDQFVVWEVVTSR
ncbi:MAG: hypothetical protein ACRDNS_29775 [Trebonia sp.]